MHSNFLRDPQHFFTEPPGRRWTMNKIMLSSTDPDSRAARRCRHLFKRLVGEGKRFPSQAALGRKLGVSAGSISHVISGHRGPSEKLISSVVRALGIPRAFFEVEGPDDLNPRDVRTAPEPPRDITFSSREWLRFRDVYRKYDRLEPAEITWLKTIPWPVTWDQLIRLADFALAHRPPVARGVSRPRLTPIESPAFDSSVFPKEGVVFPKSQKK